MGLELIIRTRFRKYLQGREGGDIGGVVEDVLGSRVKGSSSVALSISTSSTTSWRCGIGLSASSPLWAVVVSIEFRAELERNYCCRCFCSYLPEVETGQLCRSLGLSSAPPVQPCSRQVPAEPASQR